MRKSPGYMIAGNCIVVCSGVKKINNNKPLPSWGKAFACNMRWLYVNFVLSII
jgi:hypothetical protein